MRAPAIVLAVPLLAGAALPLVNGEPAGDRLAQIAAGAAATAVIAAWCWLLQEDVREAAVAAAIASLFTGLSLGAAEATRVYAPPLLTWYHAAPRRDAVTVTGYLREDAAVTPFGVSLLVDVTTVAPTADGPPGVGGGRGPPGPAGLAISGRTPGGVRLSVGGELASARTGQWRAGRLVRAPVALRLPGTFYDPGVPDDRPALARRGIVLTGTVKSAALVEVLREGGRIAEAAAAVRAGVRLRIARFLGRRSPRSAAVASAVLIGDRTALSEEDERRLRAGGTYHVIAISGGNIAILAALALAAARAAMIPSRLAAAGTAALLLFYMVVAGGAASVARAVTVACLMLAARIGDHRGPSLNALAGAAVCALAVAPSVALDPGFVLSFGATLGILLGAGAAATDGRPRGVFRALARSVGRAMLALGRATICAELALVPAAATMFGQLTFAGLLLNFAAIPLMTIVQIAAIVVCLAARWPAVANAAALTCDVAARALLDSARLVDDVPWLVRDVAPPVIAVVVAFYCAALLLLLPAWRRRAALTLAAVTAVLLVSPAWASRDAGPPSSLPLRVVVLDVGQGDATVVVLSDGRGLLVDAGGLAPLTSPVDAGEPSPGFDVGERVVYPALRALGVRKLAGLVITHGDPDHLQGARGVLLHLPSPVIWDGVPVPRHPGVRALASFARDRRISWRTVQAGDVERFGEVEIRVLHPPLPQWERQRVRNEDSVVLEVRLGRVSIVLPGDIGAEGERAILPLLEPGRLVVLKAPHHGSATSSGPELLAHLRPAAVIFSCGRDNRFGHPHPAVVSRYRDLGAALFSTADDGAVFVETDGERVEIRGHHSRRRIMADRPPPG